MPDDPHHSGRATTASHPAAGTGGAGVAAAIHRHHRTMESDLAQLTRTIATAAADSDDVSAEAVALYGWCRTELLPHLRSEDSALLTRGRERESTALVARALVDETERLRDAAEDLDSVDDPVQAASLAATVGTLFGLHAAQVDDLLVPALVDAGVDVAGAVAELPEIVGGQGRPKVTVTRTAPADDDASAHRITGTEEVDVRPLPHQGRHNVIIGKLQELADDGALVITNDHDPKPLRYQTDALWPGRFEWAYLEEGPDVWRVRITCAGR